MENEIKTGLWNKQSQSGNNYAQGKLSVNGKTYKVLLFTNYNKLKENSPDYNLILQEMEEQAKQVKEEKDEIVVTDDDLPF